MKKNHLEICRNVVKYFYFFTLIGYYSTIIHKLLLFYYYKNNYNFIDYRKVIKFLIVTFYRYKTH